MARLRTPAPRTNSCAIVPSTNAHSAKHRPELHTRIPKAYRATAVTTAATLILAGCTTPLALLPLANAVTRVHERRAYRYAM